MKSIMEIPPEVIAKILSYLTSRDIVSFSETCQRLYQASQIDLVWKDRCDKDYGVSLTTAKVTFKDLYAKLLYHYGKLIGLWQADISSYGGLLQVDYEEGSLVGKELYSPLDSNIMDPMCARLLFSVHVDDRGHTVMYCIAGDDGECHKAKVYLTADRQRFSFKCSEQEKHSQPTDKHHEFVEWLRKNFISPSELTEMTHIPNLLFMKFLVLRQYKCVCHFQHLELPKQISGVPIQPGLFKGTYGGHGLELILLTYEEDTIVRAVKVTGDPNVPAQKLTFHVNLNLPMRLTTVDQESIATLSSIQAVEVPFKKGEKTEMQPFRVPPGCYERFHQIPRTCIGRYHGWGQVAGHGFTDPSFNQGHWIIFSEDMFAFLWLELMSVSMYHRVKEIC